MRSVVWRPVTILLLKCRFWNDNEMKNCCLEKTGNRYSYKRGTESYAVKGCRQLLGPFLFSAVLEANDEDIGSAQIL